MDSSGKGGRRYKPDQEGEKIKKKERLTHTTIRKNERK